METTQSIHSKQAAPIYTKTVKDVVALLEPMFVSERTVLRALENKRLLFGIKIDCVRAFGGAPYRISSRSYEQLRVKLWREMN